MRVLNRKLTMQAWYQTGLLLGLVWHSLYSVPP